MHFSRNNNISISKYHFSLPESLGKMAHFRSREGKIINEDHLSTKKTRRLSETTRVM
jgi:hypothetical protein